MHTGKKLLAVFCVLLFAGCATPISSRAAAVQVHNQMSTLLASCKNLGPVAASVEDIVWGGESAAASAKVKAREQAADKGGDTLVVVNTDIYATSATVQGAAMRCY